MTRLLIILSFLLLPPPVFAKDIAQATQGNVTVTLTNEDCALKEHVKNLPSRAVWEEKGKTFEGCWRPTAGVIVMFFDDLTVVAAPMRAFRPVKEAI